MKEKAPFTLQVELVYMKTGVAWKVDFIGKNFIIQHVLVTSTVSTQLQDGAGSKHNECHCMVTNVWWVRKAGLR